MYIALRGTSQEYTIVFPDIWGRNQQPVELTKDQIEAVLKTGDNPLGLKRPLLVVASEALRKAEDKYKDQFDTKVLAYCSDKSALIRKWKDAGSNVGQAYIDDYLRKHQLELAFCFFMDGAKKVLRHAIPRQRRTLGKPTAG
jgi:hypothetical protein